MIVELQPDVDWNKGRAVLWLLDQMGAGYWDFLVSSRPADGDHATWVRSGDLRYREDIVDGLDAAPQAFIGLLEGRNFGGDLDRKT